MTAVSSDTQASIHTSSKPAFEHVHMPSAWRGLYATVLGAGSLLGGLDPAEVYGAEPLPRGQVGVLAQEETTKLVDLKNGEQATLLLNSNGSVYEIQCSDFSVMPGAPLSPQLAKRYAECAGNAFLKLPSKVVDSSTESYALHSKDGYRFELLIEGRNFLLTAQRAFEVIASPEYEREQFENSRIAITDLRRKLLDAVCKGLSPIEQEELAVRLDRFCLLEDLSFLRSALTEKSESLRGHRELQSLFAEQTKLIEQTLQDVEYDVLEDFTALDPHASQRIINRNRHILSDKAYKLHIEFPDQTENELKFLTEAVSRKLLLKALNRRADAIENLLQERVEKGDSLLLVQESEKLLTESRDAWDAALTILRGSSGYPAYDSKYVDASRFADAIKRLDTTAAAHEAKLGLHSDYPGVEEQSARTLLKTNETLAQLQLSTDKALGWKIKDCVSGARGYLRESPYDTNRYTISLNRGRYVEEYDNGKILKRSVMRKDGSGKEYQYRNGFKRLYRSYGSEGRVLRQVEYSAEASLREYVSDSRTNSYTQYDKNGDRLWRVQYSADESEVSKRVFYSGGRKPIGNYAFEKQKSGGTLSVDDYLTLLADRLDTPEKLETFLDAFFLYTSDNGEYFQTFRDTVEWDTSPVAGGERLKGDCDDYAFFARDILRAQGKNAHVVGVPRHATCIWLEQDSAKRYHAYSIGTFGLDKNGQASGVMSLDTVRSGFETPEEALNSLADKYGSPGLGLSQGQIFRFSPDSICILEVEEERREDGTYHSWRDEYFEDISVFFSSTARNQQSRRSY